MNVSAAGRALIREHEGCELIAYTCPAGVLTVGVGHTGPDVVKGLTITEERADELLAQDLDAAEQCVSRSVEVELTQEQFDALCSFVFNVGCGAFQRSTLLRMLNDGDYDGARKQFFRWNNSGAKELAGLTRRRADEAEMFSGIA